VTASVACALCDARTGRIPNLITYPALAFLLLLALWRHDTLATLAGAAAGGGVLLLLHLATRGRGLGLGDVKLGACIGAGLGAGAALVAIGTAFIAGACAGTLLLALRRARRGDRIAFGPFLALGTFLAMAAAHKW
jgi:prepilin signal peptidase PulO-like enzyme (type II secretory pathway)